MDLRNGFSCIQTIEASVPTVETLGKSAITWQVLNWYLELRGGIVSYFNKILPYDMLEVL